MLQGNTQYSGLFHGQRDPTVVWVQSCYKSTCVIGMFACGMRGKGGGEGVAVVACVPGYKGFSYAFVVAIFCLRILKRYCWPAWSW